MSMARASSLLWKVFILSVMVSYCIALSPSKSTRSGPNYNEIQKTDATFSPSRRVALFRTVVPALMSLTGTVGIADRALALEERNEMLCGTGFFTNIAQYMCTEIGDISGDGKAKKISQEESGSMGSLLGKLGVDDAIDSATDDEERTTRRKSIKNNNNNKSVLSDDLS